MINTDTGVRVITSIGRQFQVTLTSLFLLIFARGLFY